MANTCAATPNCSTSGAGHSRSARNDEKESAPIILPPAESGNTTNDFSPFLPRVSLSFAASSGKSSIRANFSGCPSSSLRATHGTSRFDKRWGRLKAAAAHECVMVKSSPSTGIKASELRSRPSVSQIRFWASMIWPFNSAGGRLMNVVNSPANTVSNFNCSASGCSDRQGSSLLLRASAARCPTW